MQGLIGKKLGMTQVFDDKGHRVAVTMIQAGPCVVVQRKTKDKDGYEAAQLGFLEQKESRLAKSALNRFKKVGVTPRKVLHEFGVDGGEEVKEGDTVTVKVFEGISHVDIAGMTKGKGFQGVVRRHSMSGGPAAHGSMSHRRIGAIGQREKPGNVAKGHRMPGHMGYVSVTTQNLRVVELKSDKNIMLVHGAVPGPVGAIVAVKKALKKAVKKAEKA
jgi:large subunit ribosomal protein L3